MPEPKCKYIVAILIDNTNGEKFLSQMRAGMYPSLKEHVLDRGSFCQHSICQFPSSSANGHTTLTTGTFQSKHGVLNAVYWDLSGKKPLALKIDKINFSALKLWDKIITTKTMFEYIPNHDSASFHVIKRGAGLRFFELRSLARYLPLFLKLKFKGVEAVSKKSGFLEDALMSIFNKYVQGFNKGQKFYQLTFILHLPTDLKAHKAGHDSEDYIGATKLVDAMVRILVNGFDHEGVHYPGIKDMGIYDQTAFALFADHSSKPFSQEKKLDLIKLLTQDFPGRSYSAPKFIKKEKYGPWDALFAEGGEFIQVLLPDVKDTGHIRRTLPIESLQKYQVNGSTINFKDYLFKQEAVTRIYHPITPDCIVVHGKTGIAQFTRRKGEGNARSYKYEILEGNDPLLYAMEAPALTDGQFHSHLDWLRATYQGTYPNVPDHMFGFFDCVLAPTFIVVADNGWVFWHPDDPEEHAQLYVNQHDAEWRYEVTTPFVIGGAGVKKGIEVPVCQNVDVLPTMLKLLGIPFDAADFHGRPLDEILE